MQISHRVMKMWEYRLIQYQADGLTEYGIALFCCGKEQRRIAPVSECRDDAERLTELLNGEQGEPCHFEDIIEDYFTDFTI